MDEPLISVILPIYNVAGYLRECIESVRRQTYRNLEIILVDDGATDDSPKICEEYKNVDERVKVIHKSNGGLSEARNVGIENAMGEYIALVDSDDILMPFFIEKLYSLCSEKNVLISACSFVKFSAIDNVTVCSSDSNIEVISAQTLIKRIYEGKDVAIGFTAWNKLYHRSVFNELHYPIGRIYEDTFVTYKLFLLANSIAITNESLYLYRVRLGSIMNESSLSLRKLKDGIDANASVVYYYHQIGNAELLRYAGNVFCKNAIIAYYKDVKRIEQGNRVEAKRYIAQEYKKTYVLCKDEIHGVFKRTLFFIINLIW